MNELGNTPADKNYKPSGISRAEEQAMLAYPPKFTSGKRYAKRVQSEKVDTHAAIRKIYLKGYEQAEKDLALTWEDIRSIIDAEIDVLEKLDNDSVKILQEYPSAEAYYTEVLTRFKQFKEAKQ